MLETLIKNSICDHLVRHNLLSGHRDGFVSRSSCLTNLLGLEQWTKAVDEGKQIDRVYLDFSKAFDCVLFKRLLIHLNAFGISGQLHIWIN